MQIMKPTMTLPMRDITVELNKGQSDDGVNEHVIAVTVWGVRDVKLKRSAVRVWLVVACQAN